MARILFQPIEETARAHFSKVQGNYPPPITEEIHVCVGRECHPQRGITAVRDMFSRGVLTGRLTLATSEAERCDLWAEAVETCSGKIQLVSAVGLIFVCFGPAYTRCGPDRPLTPH